MEATVATRGAPPAPRGRASAPRRRRRWVRIVVYLSVVGVVLVGLSVATLSFMVVSAPSVADAPQRVAAILDSHHAPGDGGVVPVRVSTALLATEDSRYYHDPALDPLGMVRATVGLVTRNGNDGGATIEQQLAKMLYAPGTSVSAEFKQVGLAFRLDQRFKKTAILAMYLDAAYFGDGAYGVTDAAEHYFGVAPAQLSWAQASLLAGLVQAPTEYDPHGHLSRARARQRHVLSRLVAIRVLSAQQATAVYDRPLDPVIQFYG